MSTMTTAPDPHVQVVRGTPDDVELAALVAGLVAASAARPAPDEGLHGAPGAAETAARTRWVVPAARRGVGGMPPRGHDAWRWSLRG